MNKKTKQILSLLMSLIMVMSMFAGINVSSFAADDVLDYLRWEINNGEVTITDCDRSISGDIVIPDTIEGYPVTTIGEIAFGWRERLTNVIIPDSVTTIGERAFHACTGLTNIVIPDSVTTIGDYAFNACTSLTNFIIPDSVTTISYGVFNYCTSFKNVVIPDSVTTIGDDAFSECTSLINVVIPDSVTTIGEYAFNKCDSLTSIVIPNSVTSFGLHPFYDCDNLESIAVNENNPNYSIDEYGILYNKDKTVLEQFLGGNAEPISFVIPDSVITIGDYAFSDCTNITNIIIPDSVKTIGAGAFQECGGASDILRITIQDGVTSIGSGAFAHTPITNITIPESVTTFGADMFAKCFLLESVILSNNISVIDINTFARCYNLENLNVPDNLTTINERAFEGCISLKNLVLPDSLTTIGDRAFNGCMSMESISLPESLTEIGAKAFLNCNSMKDIYIYNPDLIIGEQSLGYKGMDITVDVETFINDYLFGSLDYNNDVIIEYDEPVLIDDVTIHGYKGSTAEAYANANGIAFEAFDAECSHDNTELINIVEPDCKNNGYTGDVYCNDCEEIISYGETVPATAHNYIENIIKEPTFTQPGLKNDVCENCGDATVEVEIPQLTIEDSEEKENTDTDISIIYPDGTFDGEIEVEVTPVEEGEAYKLISHKEGNYKVTMFDINVTVDGENVQPNGTVLVKIPLPKGYNQNKCAVYYVADDGTMEELTTYHYKDGYIYFETDHFSYYAILEEEAEITEEKSFFTMIKEFFEKIIDFFKQIFESLKKLFA